MLIAEHDGLVAGYGSLGDFRPFEGYRLTVEHSLYVGAEYRGKGLRTALLAALIDEATRLGKRNMVGGIDGGNEVSLALHRRLGFIERGRLPGIGVKFDHFLDLVLLQKNL